MNDTVEIKPIGQEIAKVPAGFLIRFVANTIDSFIFIPLTIATFINILIWKNLYFAIFMFIPWMIYKPLMESLKGATLGKMACGIRVVDKDGKNISIKSSYIRYTPFFISAFPSLVQTVSFFLHPDFDTVTHFTQFTQFSQTTPQSIWLQLLAWVLFIDCLVIIFNKKKRAIHDMIGGSFCVRKKGKKMSVIAVLVIIIICLLFILGLIAAIAIPNLIKAKENTDAIMCSNNLKQMYAAKKAWADDKEIATAFPTWKDLVPKYLQEEPLCLTGGTYIIGGLESYSKCSIGENNPQYTSDDHLINRQQ